MPIHDWTRVPPGIYRDFHGGWIYAIRGALNSGLLPKGYYALAEQTTRTFGPDVLTLHNPATNGTANGAPRAVQTNRVVSRLPRPLRRHRSKQKQSVSCHPQDGYSVFATSAITRWSR